jgi:hypothetical protein
VKILFSLIMVFLGTAKGRLKMFSDGLLFI